VYPLKQEEEEEQQQQEQHLQQQEHQQQQQQQQAIPSLSQRPDAAAGDDGHSSTAEGVAKEATSVADAAAGDRPSAGDLVGEGER
jgi:hypothetical protein